MLLNKVGMGRQRLKVVVDARDEPRPDLPERLRNTKFKI